VPNEAGLLFRGLNRVTGETQLWPIVLDAGGCFPKGGHFPAKTGVGPNAAHFPPKPAPLTRRRPHRKTTSAGTSR